MSDSEEKPSSKEENLECPVCLQKCVHPVKLPCSHIFCFLCVKGASAQNQSCPMCRTLIHRDYLNDPDLIPGEDKVDSREYAWFYEGRGGWWRYDTRTSQEMEKSYQELREEEDQTAEFLIAGFIYVIDFQNSVQFRRTNPGRRRKIKRDSYDAPQKGVAGLLRKDPKNEEEILDRLNDLNLDSSHQNQRGIDPEEREPVNERHATL